MHPEDLLALDATHAFKSSEELLLTNPGIEEMRKAGPHLELADMKYGFPHKVYLHGIEPFAKFYVVHANDADFEGLVALSALLDRTVRVRLGRDERGLKWSMRARAPRKNA